MAKNKPKAKRPEIKFDSKIYDLRLARNMSLLEVAIASRTTTTTVHNAEQGYGIGLDVAMRLSAVFGRRVDQVFTILDDITPVEFQ